MKISNTQTNYPQLTNTQSVQAKMDQTVANSNLATSVSSTNEPVMAALRDAHTQLSTMPDVDMEKVAELKAAIQAGNITLEPKKLAQAMLKYHQG